jgi:hypothetical protein
LGFEAKVRRSYPIEGKRVLILEDSYRGDVEVGDVLEVGMASGVARAEVASVAWGSAFHADSPPLTLVVSGLEADPPEGAMLRSVDP